MRSSIKQEEHSQFLDIKAVSNMRFSCIRSELTVQQSILGPPLAIDDGIPASKVTRYLIFNKSSRLFISEDGGPAIFLSNILLCKGLHTNWNSVK